MVTLRVGNDRVTFDGAHWSGEDEHLVRALELLMPQYQPSFGFPDVWGARVMVAKLRELGEDVEILEAPDYSAHEADAGIVY